MCRYIFVYEISHRYLKNDHQFFGTLKKNVVKLEGIVIYE